MLKQRHQLFVGLLVLADTAMIATASYVAWAGRVALQGRWWPASWENWLKEPLLAYTIPVTILAIWAHNLYRPRRDKSLLGEFGMITRAALVAVAAVLLALWAMGSGSLLDPLNSPEASVRFPLGITLDGPRIQFALLAVSLPLFISSTRASFRLGLRTLRKRGWNRRRVAIVGVGRLGQITCRTLSRNSWTGLDVAYFVSHHTAARRETCLNRPVLGGLADVDRLFDTQPVDAVYLALPSAQASAIPDLLRKLERFPVEVKLIPDVPPRYLAVSASVTELEGMPILSYRESPTYGLGGIAKRSVDIAGAIVGILLFSPLMAAIAIAVRFSGPGRVIFKQKRMGLNGEIFNIYKFRTMNKEAKHDAPSWTKKDDPRVTRVGKFLRKTSLDELPQLINVLGGRMSLVGPRPERPELIQRFRDDWRGYMLRQHVKSGITGWAQVNGLRGDTSLRKRLQYDLFYIRHWSVWFDLRILFLTVFRGFIHQNAH